MQIYFCNHVVLKTLFNEIKITAVDVDAKINAGISFFNLSCIYSFVLNMH